MILLITIPPNNEDVCEKPQRSILGPLLFHVLGLVPVTVLTDNDLGPAQGFYPLKIVFPIHCFFFLFIFRS